jgi:hypothetical protein
MQHSRGIDISRQSLAPSRAHDARLCWLVENNPVAAAMLVRLGWFPNNDNAVRLLRRLVTRKRIRLVGTVCRRSGRPEGVYCHYRPKADQLLHEVELTELCLRLGARCNLCGPHVRDQRMRPDAEVRIGGTVYYLELDRGTMSGAQIARRFRKYEWCKQLVLRVCPTAARREVLRRQADRLRHAALFTTFAEALASPHEAAWQDYTGDRAALPREADKPPGNNPGPTR